MSYLRLFGAYNLIVSLNRSVGKIIFSFSNRPAQVFLYSRPFLERMFLPCQHRYMVLTLGGHGSLRSIFVKTEFRLTDQSAPQSGALA